MHVILKHLIPKDMRESLNQNPTFQWVVVVFMVVVGILLVVKGVDGLRNKRLTGKHGRVFKGTTAQVLGALYAAMGTLLAVIAVVMKFAT